MHRDNIKLSALIVEDEPAARDGLAADVNDIPYMEVVAVAANAADASRLIVSMQPAVIFLDIQMPGMTGLDLVRSLNEKPLVILTTAFSEYALESYDLGVVDYLLKPISPARLRLAADKAFESYRSKRFPLSGAANPDYIFLKCNGRIEKISLDDIYYFEGANNYVHVYTKGSKFLSYMTLKGVEEQLPPGQFVKIHKSFIVSKRHIHSMDKSTIRVNDVDIPLSKTFRDAVRKDLLDQKFLRRSI